jgi:ATP-dependent DNA helicase RecG
LLIIHYLTRHREISTTAAARICQRPVEGAREMLSALSSRWRLLEGGGGAGQGRYYRLSRKTYRTLLGTLAYDVDKRLSRENAKARVLDVLRERSLTNSEIREITQLGRSQALRLMKSLEREGLVQLVGQRRGSRWRLAAR